MNKITKQLENLYSWTQFYQERGNKDQIRKCQTQIAELKKVYNQLKSNKNGKTKNAKRNYTIKRVSTSC